MSQYHTSQQETISTRGKLEFKEKCREKILQLLNHGNIITVRHLNVLKLHLNKRGTQVLSNKLAEANITISNITN